MIDADPALGLRVVVEQGGVQIGQLGRFVGLRYDEALRLADDWRHAGWVEVHQFLVGEDPWLEPLWSGAKLSGTGLARRPLRMGHLLHRQNVNEARLYLEAQAPNGLWVPERLVRRAYKLPLDRPVPDGVLEIDGERHAIEVELSSKPRAKIVAKLAGYAGRYDRVVYFCATSVLGGVQSVAEATGNAQLVVRGLPWAERPRDGGGTPTARRSAPLSEERPLLELAADLGAMRLDHLTRLSGLSFRHVSAVVDAIEASGFGRSVSVFPTESTWLWPNGRGVRAVGGVGQGLRSLTAARAVEIAAANEVRCTLAEELPGGIWRSARREVVAGRCERRDAPTAIVETGKRLRAVMVVVVLPRDSDVFLRRVRAWQRKYDEVLIFAAPGSPAMGRLSELDLDGVELRPIAAMAEVEHE